MTPLRPSEFAAAVEDYADHIDDEQYVRLSYAGQLAAVGHHSRDPLDPVVFVAALVAHADVDVNHLDRERIEYAYHQQIERARRAGD